MQSSSQPHGVAAVSQDASSNLADVVYKKGSTQAYSWQKEITNKRLDAFFNLWKDKVYNKIKPRIVDVYPGQLLWFRNHLKLPDEVSSLVRAFLVQPRIPPTAINLDPYKLEHVKYGLNDRTKLEHEEYRKEKAKGPHVVLDNVLDNFGLESYWAVIDSQNPKVRPWLLQ